MGSCFCDYGCQIICYGDLIQPMPWIGLYAAVASLICTLGMAADTIHGIRSKKLWFPCKFFSLNATTLTLLAVAMKLSLDLSTKMSGTYDQLAKLSTIIFLPTAMGNCLTSLGSMGNQSILTNVVALVILVVTVIVNIIIQLFNAMTDPWFEFVIATGLMLVLLLKFVSSALSVPTTKKYIEARYQEIHQMALREQQDERGKFTAENLKFVIRKYWVMAATGNPQFVMARSATCTSCGPICLLITLTLVETAILVPKNVSTSSDYKWSTLCILAVQSIGIAVGSIAPILRWFTAVNFKCSGKGSKSCKNELKIETYWTRWLKDWQESSLSLSIRSIKCKKFVHYTRYLALSSCIKVQIVNVLASKISGLFSTCLLNLFLLFLSSVKILKVEPKFESSASTDQNGQESSASTDQNGQESGQESSASTDQNGQESGQESGPGQELKSYVLLLEGEVGLPRRTLQKIFCEVDQLILTGKKGQPKFLIELLGKSSSYDGVANSDSDRVPSLHSEELPNCWTLPVVTLATIAIAVPNIHNGKSDWLLRSASQGLRYAKIIDECQKTRRDFVNISNAADVVWVGVELYHKWLDEDLDRLKGKTSKEILEGFAEIAERSIMEFKRNTDGKLMKNPIYWPSKAIAAHSMYRISKTLLLAYEGDNDISDEELFEKLYVMIADIFAACFTGLPRLIIMKCHCDAIEKREASVRQAALLLGESEKILEILQQRHASGTIPDQAAGFDEWRVFFKQRSPPASTSSFTNEATDRQCSSEGDAVEELEA